MTDQPTRTDLNRIVVGLDSLEARVDGAKAQSATTARKARNMTAAAIFVALLGVLVGARGWVVAEEAQEAADTAQAAAVVAQDAIDAVNDFLDQSRFNSCKNYNEQLVPSVNSLNDRTQDMLRTVLAGSDNPETLAFVTEQVALYEAAKTPFRDCSDAGLEAFSNGTGGYLPLGTEP